MKHKFSEHIGRSVVKALTFRVLVTVTDVAIVLMVTRSWQMAVAAAAGIGIVHSVLYFVHERVWNGLEWGRGREGH